MDKYRKYCAESVVLIDMIQEDTETKYGKVVVPPKLWDSLVRLADQQKRSFNRDMMFNLNEQKKRYEVLFPKEEPKKEKVSQVSHDEKPST